MSVREEASSARTARLPRIRTEAGRIPASVLVPLLVVGLLAVAIWSVTTGALGVAARDVVRVVAGSLGIGDTTDIPLATRTVVMEIRIPRMLLASAVGASLGVCGAALQGVFANPLADPGLIGTSSGAALGAVLGIVTGVGHIGSWTTPMFAFAGALIVTALVYRIARHEGRTEVVTLVLSGIAVNAVVMAIIGYLTAWADDQELRSIVFWQLGSMAAARWQSVMVAGAFALAGILLLPARAHALDLLALGETQAGHLGVNTERLRITVLALSALVVGAAVAVSGIIAFVGLVVPHLVRLIAGPSHRTLLPACAVGGALLLVAADTIARTVVAPAELPLGVLTSAVGGVFFVWLLMATRREQGGWG